MRNIVSAFVGTLILVASLIMLFDVRLVQANGTIYIRANGSIDPPTANISSTDNVTYAFTNNNYASIMVERRDIMVDGAGYTLQGPGSGTGFYCMVDNVTLRHANIDNFYLGVLLSSSGSSIHGNSITNSVYGVTLDSSSTSNVSGNTIATSWCGVQLRISAGNVLSGNSIADSLYGFWVSTSSSNRFSGNTMANCTHGIHLEGSSDNRIDGNNVTDTEQGIVVQDSPASDIAGNLITNTASGFTQRPNAVVLGSSNHSMVNGNEVHMVDGTYEVVQGILGANSSHCLIEGNNIHGPTFTGASGIALDNCQNITVRRNTISGKSAGSGIGIVTDQTCSTVLVVENTVSGWFFGLWPFTPPTPSGNRAYQNNFVNNAAQVVQGVLQTPWEWDDGYPSGGNYWSDYTASDVKCGPYQNQTGSDGIGDSPYVINSNNQDRYPLMKPYPWAPHDLGVTSLAVSKTAVGQGYTVLVNVTVFNYGNNTEHFSVTLSANTTLVHTFEDMTLASRNSIVLAFTWDTSDFDKSSYALTAVANAVLGETDITDNMLAGDPVMVTLAGDVDGDQVVDIFDIVRMAGVYGLRQSDSKYDPNCDIDGDGDIDIFDIVIAAGNYGKSW